MLGRYKVEDPPRSFGPRGPNILAERRTDRERCDNKRRENRAKKDPANTIGNHRHVSTLAAGPFCAGSHVGVGGLSDKPVI